MFSQSKPDARKFRAPSFLRKPSKKESGSRRFGSLSQVVDLKAPETNLWVLEEICPNGTWRVSHSASEVGVSFLGVKRTLWKQLPEPDLRPVSF